MEMLLRVFMMNMFLGFFVSCLNFLMLEFGLINVIYNLMFKFLSLFIILLIELLFLLLRGFFEVIKMMILEIEEEDIGNIIDVVCRVLLRFWFFLRCGVLLIIEVKLDVELYFLKLDIIIGWLLNINKVFCIF